MVISGSSTTANIVAALNKCLDEQEGDLRAVNDLRAEVAALQHNVKLMQVESTNHDEELQAMEQTLTNQECYRNVLKDGYDSLCQCALASNHHPFPNTVFIPNSAYTAHPNIIPVSMGQVQAMESLYLNLPSSVAGPSSTNGGSGPSSVPVTGAGNGNIAGSSRAARYSFGESVSGFGPQK